MSEIKTIKVGDWAVSPARNQLERDGQSVKLKPRAMDVLVYLADRPGEVVSTDELISTVWKGRVVGDGTVYQSINQLRQALGDDTHKASYIETIAKRGYRLIADVTLVSSIEPQQEESITGRTLRNLPFAIVTVVAMALAYFAYDNFKSQPESVDNARNIEGSVAVMPFTNLSAESSNQFFADGIHDDLLTRISNIQDIKTISRTSVMTYRDSDKNLRSIAKELGVDTILEGGVQRSGDQVRINLQLIDAESDVHLWAQTYTRELTATNVFEIQAEITEAVAGALQTVLTADERTQIEKQPTANLQALDAYYLGNQLYNQATSESVAEAVLAYQAAIALDPEFALAYSKLALASIGQIWFNGLSTESQLEKSRPLIDRAIMLDPDSSEAYTALGVWFRESWDIDKAEQAYKQAITRGPNNVSALANYGSLKHWRRSDPASAIKLYSRAVELDPRNIVLKCQLARAMPWVGQASEGIQILEGIVAEHPDSAIAYRNLANMYSDGESRHDKGIKALRKAFELDPNHPPNAFQSATLHWKLGDYDKTAQWMNYAARLALESEAASVYRGWALINQGDFESAREEFDRTNADSVLYWLGFFYLGGLDTAEGRPVEALERYEEYAAKFDGRKSNVNFHYGIASIKAYQALGEHEKAQDFIDQFMSIISANPSMTYHDSATNDASIYALSGQKEAAIAILEEWVNLGGAHSLLRQDVRHGLSSLNDDPRYQSILRTVDNRLREQRANLARWEASGEMPPIPKEVTNPW